jgi:hypothetical protein
VILPVLYAVVGGFYGWKLGAWLERIRTEYGGGTPSEGSCSCHEPPTERVTLIVSDDEARELRELLREAKKIPEKGTEK